jgi:3-oxoisoapionate decarboxylase
MTAFDLIEAASRLGVRVVQFCDNLPLTGLPPSALEMFAQRVRELGLQIELGTRGMAPSNLRKHLELARRFNCQFVRLVTDSAGEEPSPEQVIARLKEILPEFAAAGICLAIENHDRFSSATLARIVEQLGPDRVGICLDTVNSFGALEGPEVVVKTLAPYTLNLHVKDFTIERVGSQMGFSIYGCAAGKGRLDIPWLLEQLRASNRDVNAILELWTPFFLSLPDTVAQEAKWAEESVRYLRQFITQ